MGSKYSINISNSTVGSVAVGDGASAEGHVSQGSGSPISPQGEAKAPAAASQSSGSPQQAAAGTPIDFAILTAIEVERRAVCAAFGLGDDHRVKKGGRWYWRGQLPLADDSRYELIVAQPADMGQVEATALTKDVLRDWKPAAALLVGIAATTDPEKIKLGDVVVGKGVWYYEHGKITEKGIKPQPEMMPAAAGLLQHFTGLEDWDGQVGVERPDGTETKPKVHQGVIASGEKVIADAAVRDEIASGHRKIIAIAMEEHGFSRAIWQSPEPVQHLVIRGICDDGSPAKDDRWHAYAAGAAATFAKHFLMDRPAEPRVRLRPANDAEVKLRSLRHQGRLPILDVKSRSRHWDKPSGQVQFQMEIANIGPCPVYRIRYARDEMELSSPLMPLALRPQETLSFAFTTGLPARRGYISEKLRFRYSTEFGDELEDICKLIFDPSTAGGDNGGVSLKHQAKWWVRESDFVDD